MINFLLTNSRDYRLVQEQILGQVLEHMPEGSYQKTFYERAEGCLNFSLFIVARGEKKLKGKCDIRDPEFLKYLPDVVMSHGLADKHYLTKRDDNGEYYVRRMKHILVPGPWLKRKLLSHRALFLLPTQIHCVGWPRFDILKPQAEKQRSGARSIHGRKIRILWAPTHDFVKRGPERESTSSYPALESDLPLLKKYFDVDISLHPRNRSEKTPTVEKLINCDYVISDFGTLVYEAWALGKPVIFPRWILKNRIQEYMGKSAEGYIFEKNIGLHAWSIEEMIEMIKIRPSLSDDVIAFLNDYIEPAHDRCSAKRIAEVLLALDSPPAQRYSQKAS